MSIVKKTNSFSQIKQASNADLFSDKSALSILVSSYDAIVGTPAQVLGGIATHASLQSAINAVPSEGRILFLSTTVVENININKTVTIEGKGHGSKIVGTVTFQASADYCLVQGLRISDNVTFNLGSDANFFINNWLAPTKTVSDAGSANYKTWIQE